MTNPGDLKLKEIPQSRKVLSRYLPRYQTGNAPVKPLLIKRSGLRRYM
jgi:hypothetical protein